MDVILDTNVFAADFRMQKNQFANLLDYLRRTDSALVICKVVWDEVRAEYAERLKGDVERLRNAWEKLDEVRFGHTAPLATPAVTQQVEQFEDRLKAPAKGVRVVFHEDYSRLDINEIVRRGIRRIRPASNSGEELRDVILWLHAVDYAKQNSRQVAFVSHDETFIEEPEGSEGKNKKSRKVDEESEDADKDYKLHPHLQKDLLDMAVDIRFYRFLSTFNRRNALRSFPATGEWLRALGISNSIEESVGSQVSALLLQRQGYAERIKEVSINSLEFREGTVHETDTATQFAELRFKTGLRLLLESYPTQNLGFQGPSYSYVQSNFQPQMIYSSNQFVVPPVSSVVYGHMVGGPIILQPGHNVVNTSNFATQVGGGPVYALRPEMTRVRQTTLNADLTVSVRIKQDRLSEFEIEKFAFEPSDDPLFGLTLTYEGSLSY